MLVLSACTLFCVQAWLGVITEQEGSCGDSDVIWLLALSSSTDSPYDLWQVPFPLTALVSTFEEVVWDSCMNCDMKGYGCCCFESGWDCQRATGSMVCDRHWNAMEKEYLTPVSSLEILVLEDPWLYLKMPGWWISSVFCLSTESAQASLQTSLVHHNAPHLSRTWRWVHFPVPLSPWLPNWNGQVLPFVLGPFWSKCLVTRPWTEPACPVSHKPWKQGQPRSLELSTYHGEAHPKKQWLRFHPSENRAISV